MCIRDRHRRTDANGFTKPVYDIINLRASEDQVIMTSSKMVAGIFLENQNPAKPLNDRRNAATATAAVDDLTLFVSEEEEGNLTDDHISIFNWPARISELNLLNKNTRLRTRLYLSPFEYNRPIMRKELETLFQKSITTEELASMAWLLGFWLGDGHKRDPYFAINREDVDVNSTLEEYGKIWGMETKYWANPHTCLLYTSRCV